MKRPVSAVHRRIVVLDLDWGVFTCRDSRPIHPNITNQSSRDYAEALGWGDWRRVAWTCGVLATPAGTTQRLMGRLSPVGVYPVGVEMWEWRRSRINRAAHDLPPHWAGVTQFPTALLRPASEPRPSGEADGTPT
jgi:hypothetical protein